jgi:type IV secretion system protein VirB1
MLPSPDLIHQCAPNVAPETVQAIIRVESGGNPYAIGVNGPIHQKPHPKNAQEAIYWAKYYMNLGYSVDLGLMQINSGNLKGLGLTLSQVFDPCINLKAGSRILSRGYAGAAKRYGPGQTALKAALSAYNTGNYERGFHNGYVAKYFPGNGVALSVKVKAPAPLLASAKLKASKPSRVLAEATLPVDPLADMPYTTETTIYIQPQAFDNVISWE